MEDNDFIQTEDPKGELEWINIKYQIDQHIHIEKDIPLLLMSVSLKDGFPSFKRVLFKFRPKTWGRMLLSIDQEKWFETLLLEYEELSYGTISVFTQLQLLVDKFKGALPELDIEIIK
jgi:hypothetical protein